MTDTQVLNWIERNCHYMEHNGKMPDGYWPQEKQDFDNDPSQERFYGLSLREYVETRIKEAEQCAE
jgi:hypothetical protein